MFSVSNVLGKEGQGVYILMSGLDIERTLGSAGPLGWASFWILIWIFICFAWFQRGMFLIRKTKALTLCSHVWFGYTTSLCILRVCWMRTYLWSIYSDCKLEILRVFIFQLGQNSMDAHEKIFWFWSESFNFTKRHEQESPVYDHVFNDLPYMCMYLYIWKKKPSINISNAFGFWVSLTQNCKHWTRLWSKKWKHLYYSSDARLTI